MQVADNRGLCPLLLPKRVVGEFSEPSKAGCYPECECEGLYKVRRR